MKFVNVACGNSFVNSPEWINFNFVANSPCVIASDLLKPLPLPSNSCDAVYSSHFFEHIPLHQLPLVLSDWRRVLKPTGVLRIVLPDCEEMFGEYLRLRAENKHLYADFVIAEIVDQCVRSYPGGKMGRLYELAASEQSHDKTFADFIKSRNGEDLSYFALSPQVSRQSGKIHLPVIQRLFLRIKSSLLARARKLHQSFKRSCLTLLYGSAFVEQNISFSNVGERHHWLWDFHQVNKVLLEAGFSSIVRHKHSTSSIPEFPFFPLDQLPNGSPRKGKESMYIEAVKLP